MQYAPQFFRLRNQLFIIFLLITGSNSFSQKVYPPVIDADKVVVYKTTKEATLKLWIFNPPKHVASSQAPAIVFFFGGGWNAGSPMQFVEQCKYLAARGMVAMVSDYRVASRHKVKANSCVSDAKSAIRWIRSHANELGVDPLRIAAGGGSAGGHLAASTGLLPGLDEPGDDLTLSSQPNAMVLFNPAVVLAPFASMTEEQAKKFEKLKTRLGAEPTEISPFHHIRKGLPPCIIFHGRDDNTVPFESVRVFNAKMQKMGNACSLIAYKNKGHGFFNYGSDQNGPFVSTMQYTDRFFSNLGWIKKLPESDTM